MDFWLNKEKDGAVAAQIKTAAQVGLLVPFVGAGVSRLCGQPSWDGFADKTIKRLIEENIISHAENELLRASGVSPRTKLSLCEHLWKPDGSGGGKALWDGFFPADESRAAKTERTTKAVWRLAERSQLVVTTNYDGLLRSQSQTRATITASSIETTSGGTVPTVEQGADARINLLRVDGRKSNRCLVEWHGSTQYPDRMVVTLRQLEEAR
jgi:hypothetical protein